MFTASPIKRFFVSKLFFINVWYKLLRNFYKQFVEAFDFFLRKLKEKRNSTFNLKASSEVDLKLVKIKNLNIIIIYQVKA